MEPSFVETSFDFSRSVFKTLLCHKFIMTFDVCPQWSPSDGSWGSRRRRFHLTSHPSRRPVVSDGESNLPSPWLGSKSRYYHCLTLKSLISLFIFLQYISSDHHGWIHLLCRRHTGICLSSVSSLGSEDSLENSWGEPLRFYKILSLEVFVRFVWPTSTHSPSTVMSLI